MKPDEEFTKIEELKRRLDSKQELKSEIKRSVLPNRYRNLKTAWTDLPDNHPVKQLGGFNFLYQILMISALFFAGTLAVAGFVLLQGSNIVSKKNIDVVLNVPQTSKAGDAVSLQLAITNRNKLPIENVVVSLTYPADTKVAEPIKATVNNKPVVEIAINSIRPGETVSRNLTATFFGQENEQKPVTASLNYKIAGSQALYTKEVAANITINSPPATLAVEVPPEAVSGGPVTLNLKVTSNAESKLANTLLFVEWPSGFKLDSTVPSADFGDNVFSLGDLTANQEKKIKITGHLEGSTEDLKTFHFRLGSGAGLNNDLDIVYADVFKAVTIKEPFISAQLAINGNTSKEVVLEGDNNVSADLKFTNNLTDPVKDIQIKVNLRGLVVDPDTLSANGGLFDPKTSTITWTRVSNNQLGQLAPGDKGQVSFNFRTRSLLSSQMGRVTNPSFTVNVSLTGSRVTSGYTGDAIETTLQTTAKIKTVFQMAIKALRKSGEIINSGPLPPQAGQESTYTIVWSIANSSSNIDGAVAKAVLPLGARFTGNFSPEDEDLSFNSVSNEVTWNLGQVKPGDGAVREVSFQVAVTPSLDQVGNYLPLIGDVSYSGNDSFTQTTISGTKRGLDTNLKEAGYGIDDGKVVK